MIVVFGLGAHGRGVADALLRHDTAVVAADDQPSEAAVGFAVERGIELRVAPDESTVTSLLAAADGFVPTPGLPENHLLFRVADRLGTPVVSEFDLAQMWDSRPMYAVTGTDGKTTVTDMVAAMIEAAGRHTIVAGNTEPPLVTAIDDPTFDCFVVEASSFRLASSSSFRPAVGAWLNFAPDHLDVHRSLDDYAAAKGSIWSRAGDDDVAVANADDPVVMSHVPAGVDVETFSIAGLAAPFDGDPNPTGSAYRVADGMLVVADEPMIAVDAMVRSLPHDVANALAAAAVATAAGVARESIAQVLTTYRGLPHRVELVADADGVRWYNDSKATTPHAVRAGVGGFERVVLVAGGKNKGLALSELADVAAPNGPVRAVVAIGASADEVVDTFGSLVETVRADTMIDAITVAARLAGPGDAVVLSPGCTSYDWYSNYGERGDDFRRLVRRHVSDDHTTEVAS